MPVENIQRIEELVPLRNAIVTVADKTGLDRFAQRLVRVCPQVRFYATGGTYAVLRESLGATSAQRVVEMTRYTTQPVTHAGLARTIDFKLYIGLLADPFNNVHVQDLSSAGAAFFDMVVSNVHSLDELTEEGRADPEAVRLNLDIGGPGMLRAGVRNYLRVANVVDPQDYERIADHIEENGGNTALDLRLELARKALRLVARNDLAMADYLDQLEGDRVRSRYTMA